METPDFQRGVAEAERLLEARRIVPALNTHLMCVIGTPHVTDGGERVPGVGLVCPDHLAALQRWRLRGDH
jgi:hypothetical protein